MTAWLFLRRFVYSQSGWQNGQAHRHDSKGAAEKIRNQEDVYGVDQS